MKKLSFEELMDIEVTSVSKSPEKLAEVASAIQVINSDDIHRSGSTRLPEILRLAPNLQIAQASAHDWAITARGFNGAPLSNVTLANKFLVMVDGRSVYEPLLGGVFWDVQNVLTEDINRIEIISGPGGTQWGANAVNGVINVISKEAKETQGFYGSVISGTFLQDHICARYGSHKDSSFYFRVYGQRYDHKSTLLENGKDGRDKWKMNQLGFRSDYYLSKENNFTLQGDLYDGSENDSAIIFLKGMNLIGRWNRSFSKQSNLSIQFYYDHTYRDYTVSGFKDKLNTYDIDLQHDFNIGKSHHLVWGAGYRVQDDMTN
ncbi:MAG TPA: TonB-dependent receptor, partial [Saprospiraceae bacterium]|nr:TonB-dependent receptor [Saprospiraceae bacterium]